MGDISALLASLNLSPVNTILLAALVFVLKHLVNKFESRVIALEKTSRNYGRSISWIKGHIDGDEPKDDD